MRLPAKLYNTQGFHQWTVSSVAAYWRQSGSKAPHCYLAYHTPHCNAGGTYSRRSSVSGCGGAWRGRLWSPWLWWTGPQFVPVSTLITPLWCRAQLVRPPVKTVATSATHINIDGLLSVGQTRSQNIKVNSIWISQLADVEFFRNDSKK